MTGMFIKILAGAVAEDLAQRREARWPCGDWSPTMAPERDLAIGRVVSRDASCARKACVSVAGTVHWQVLPASPRRD